MILEYASGTIVAKLEHSQKILLQDVEISLDAGNVMAMIGETGSGKTMAALSIMGLLPDNVIQTHSKTRVLGTFLSSSKEQKKLLGTEIVYIPQNGLEFLNPARKVKGQMYDSLKKLKMPKSQWKSFAEKTLGKIGFEEPAQILEKYPFQLSGGMAQKVTIALAACSKAKLVIADEPTNGLDYQAKVQFMQLLEQLFPKAAKLIITHDITVASLCETTLVLSGGRMMEKGPSKAILEHPHHPYTKALMGALVENGMQQTPILRKNNGNCPFFKRCPRAKEACFLEKKAEEKTEWWCSESL